MATHFPRFDAYPEAEIPLPRLRSIGQLWSCAAVLASLGVAALAVDTFVAHRLDRDSTWRWVNKLSDLSEPFGHGLGIALIALTIVVLDPWHRYAVPRILAAALGSGIAANLLKALVARERPSHFGLDAPSLESFGSWLPVGGNPSWEQSFPSAHVATAAGLAIVLAHYYPRGRWLFPAFVALVGLQRITGGSHYLSDLLWGAAVGCIFAPLCLYGGRLSQSFDRLEGWFMRRRVAAHRRVPGFRQTAPTGTAADKDARAA